MEKSSFIPGNPPGTPHRKPTAEDGSPKDEYYGKYKPDSSTPDEKWGENLNPLRETPLPASGLKSVGG